MRAEMRDIPDKIPSCISLIDIQASNTADTNMQFHAICICRQRYPKLLIRPVLITYKQTRDTHVSLKHQYPILIWRSPGVPK